MSNELPDILALVPSDPDRKRDHTIPVPGWWLEAVGRELGRRDLKQNQFSSAAGLDPTAVSKLLNGKGFQLSLVLAISDALELPYPVLLPESEDIARELAKEHRLRRRDRQLDEILAGVAENPGESQTSPVQPEHVFRQGERSSGTAVDVPRKRARRGDAPQK